MDAVVQRIAVRPGVQYEPTHQTVAELVAEPHQVPGVGARYRRRFDLDPDDPAVGELAGSPAISSSSSWSTKRGTYFTAVRLSLLPSNE